MTHSVAITSFCENSAAVQTQLVTVNWINQADGLELLFFHLLSCDDTDYTGLVSYWSQIVFV